MGTAQLQRSRPRFDVQLIDWLETTELVPSLVVSVAVKVPAV